MKFKLSIVVLGASLLGLPVPASAAQFSGFNKSLSEKLFGSSLVHKVRSRGRGGRGRGRGRGGNAAGAAAAGAAIGFFGAMIANEAARAHEERVEDCYRRHRRGYFYRHGDRIYCDDL